LESSFVLQGSWPHDSSGGAHASGQGDHVRKHMAEPDAPAKLLIEKSVINPRRVYTEDFRGAGNISEIIGSHAAMNIVEILIWEIV
jgi:hypothetical protein